jgi:hypothetical protein
MFGELLIKKDGNHEYFHDYNESEVVKDITRFFGSKVRVEDGVTFGDIFRIVLDNHKVFQLVFDSDLGFHDLTNWQEEFNAEPDKINDDLKWVEVSSYGEYCVKDNGENELSIALEFVGMGKPGEEDIAYGTPPDQMIGYSFSFTPINQLKHLPFKINNEFKIYKLNLDRKKDEKPDLTPVVHGEKSITLYEMFSAILDDISFFGHPEARDLQGQELQQSYEDVKSGKAKTIPIEELFDNLDLDN